MPWRIKQPFLKKKNFLNKTSLTSIKFVPKVRVIFCHTHCHRSNLTTQQTNSHTSKPRGSILNKTKHPIWCNTNHTCPDDLTFNITTLSLSEYGYKKLNLSQASSLSQRVGVIFWHIHLHRSHLVTHTKPAHTLQSQTVLYCTKC